MKQNQVNKIKQPKRAQGGSSNKKPLEVTQKQGKSQPGTIIVGVGSPPIGRRNAPPGLDAKVKFEASKWSAWVKALKSLTSSGSGSGVSVKRKKASKRR